MVPLPGPRIYKPSQTAKDLNYYSCAFSVDVQGASGSVLLVTLDFSCRFDPDRFADEPVMKVFSSLGFSGTWECPELR
jgi:hypothetical protein